MASSPTGSAGGAPSSAASSTRSRSASWSTRGRRSRRSSARARGCSRVWTTRSPTRNGVPAIGCAVGVQARAQLGVERVDAGRPAVHRGERPGPRRAGRGRSGPAGAAAASETTSSRIASGAVALDDEEVAQAAGPGGGRRRLAVVDRVRGADDQRPRGLAEDLGQAHDRARRRDSMRSSSTRPAPTGASWSASPTSSTCVRGPTAREQRVGQAQREHRGLVDDEHVGAGDRVLGVAGEALARGTTRAGGGWSSPRAPVISASRRAALPVGAHRRTRALLARAGGRRARASSSSCRCPARR